MAEIFWQRCEPTVLVMCSVIDQGRFDRLSALRSASAPAKTGRQPHIARLHASQQRMRFELRVGPMLVNWRSGGLVPNQHRTDGPATPEDGCVLGTVAEGVALDSIILR